MIQPKLVGQKAPAIKYDILTALGLIGLHGPTTQSVSMQRLCVLLTARYNWRLAELSVGQNYMAKMLNVTERTIKREVKRWTTLEVLTSKRKGVRGRVGAYQLNLTRVAKLSEPFWEAVGPDYADRMAEAFPKPAETVVAIDFTTRSEEGAECQPPSPWRPVSQRMKALYPQQHASWLSQLQFVSDVDQIFTLRAPSAFAAQYIKTHLGAELNAAIAGELGASRRLVIAVE